MTFPMAIREYTDAEWNELAAHSLNEIGGPDANRMAAKFLNGMFAMHNDLLALVMVINSQQAARATDRSPLEVLAPIPRRQVLALAKLHGKCLGAATLLVEAGYGAPGDGILPAAARDAFLEVRHAAERLLALA